MRTLLSYIFNLVFPASDNAKRVAEACEEDILTCFRPIFTLGTTTLTSYKSPLIRALIHEAKFHQDMRALELLALPLKEHFKENKQNGVYFVPIPLSSRRHRERGYNQITEILKRTTTNHNQILTDILKKERHTDPQTSLSRDERKSNLEGVFSVINMTLDRNTHLILVDDVITTGTTLMEAEQTLRSAGFAHIEKLALAH